MSNDWGIDEAYRQFAMFLGSVVILGAVLWGVLFFPDDTPEATRPCRAVAAVGWGVAAWLLLWLFVMRNT